LRRSGRDDDDGKHEYCAHSDEQIFFSAIRRDGTQLHMAVQVMTGSKHVFRMSGESGQENKRRRLCFLFMFMLAAPRDDVFDRSQFGSPL
jgi:hypothetical protein